MSIPALDLTASSEVPIWNNFILIPLIEIATVKRHTSETIFLKYFLLVKQKFWTGCKVQLGIKELSLHGPISNQT